MASQDAKGTVFDIQRFSLHDGPGIRTLVFLKGCPLSCQWCCNPESINPSPEVGFMKERCNKCGKCKSACKVQAITLSADGLPEIDRKLCNNCGDCVQACLPRALVMYGKEMTAAEVVEEVRRDELFYGDSGGITMSGGEPLRQHAFVKAVFELCRQAGIRTAMETSGFATKQVWQELLPFLDCVLYDLKLLNCESHQKYTGQPNTIILENAALVAKSGVPVLFRIPLVISINGTPENIRATADFIKSLQESGAAVELMPYHRLGLAKYNALGRSYTLEGLRPSELARVEAVRRAYEDMGVRCTVSK
ncbi:MAG: glycyl-radical enzyme activating protein [Chloroflexi bacterium]|nr:glycyl-radical enzyme activating protein [Chloroflexota bacterium]